jgi:hypothetical protein
MQFESKKNRSVWMAAALGAIPDLVIAIALAAALDGGFLGFALIWLGLQVLYLAIWLKDSIWAWAIFLLGGRKRVVAQLLDHLRENGYPEPSAYERSAEGYLASIVDNETLPIALRLKAASDIGAMSYLDSSMEVQKSLRIGMVYEDALEQFKRNFQSTGRDPTATAQA